MSVWDKLLRGITTAGHAADTADAIIDIVKKKRSKAKAKPKAKNAKEKPKAKDVEEVKP